MPIGKTQPDFEDHSAIGRAFGKVDLDIQEFFDILAQLKRLEPEGTIATLHTDARVLFAARSDQRAIHTRIALGEEI